MKAMTMATVVTLGFLSMVARASGCDTDPCVESPLPATVTAPARGECEGSDCRGERRVLDCSTSDCRGVLSAAGDCEGNDCRGARVHPWREGMRFMRHGI